MITKKKAIIKYKIFCNYNIRTAHFTKHCIRKWWDKNMACFPLYHAENGV